MDLKKTLNKTLNKTLKVGLVSLVASGVNGNVVPTIYFKQNYNKQ